MQGASPHSPGRVPAPTLKLALTAFLVGLVALLAAPSAGARKPIISYVDADGALKLYDAELGADVAAPPVEIPGMVPRYSISLDGRYVFWLDDGMPKRLHLFDRATGAEVPLPGIDQYMNPGGLTVSNTGLVAFDDNGNGPALVYDPVTGDFVDTGLDGMNGHRQTRLSGDGRFLATTCVTGCEEDQGGDASAFVQNLAAQADTAFPDDLTGADDEDEEHPCVDGDGSLVGVDITNPMQRDIFLYDRAAGAVVDLPGLNDPAKEDTFCVIDAAGDYIGYLFDNAEFRVYERSSGSLLPLPPRPFTTASTFSAPFTPGGAASPDFVVSLEIDGGKVRVSRRGRVRIPITCPAGEVSPPCAGELKLNTRGKVRPPGKQPKLRLTRAKPYSLGAGQRGKVKLRIPKPKLKLVRKRRAARRAKVKASVVDAAGNEAKEKAKLKLKPRRERRD